MTKNNDNTPIDAEVIETSTENSVEETKSPNTDTKPDGEVERIAKKGSRLGTLAIIISLIAGAGAIGFAYNANQQAELRIAQLQAQLKQAIGNVDQKIDSAQSSLESSTKTLVDHTEVTLNQQQKSIDSLQLALAEVKGRRPNDWLLAESDYLVKLAGRKLFLEHDAVTATHLMESADQRIAALNDPSLVPLRRAMANDITALKAVPLVDRDGLVLRLISLQNQVDTLPLANALLPDAPEEQHAEVSTDINQWQDNLMTSLKNFSEHFITFRTRDGNVIPLLSPEQHFYLRENLKAKLETAIRAIYEEKQAIYTTSLETAVKWSKSYLNLSDSNVVQFNKSLSTLVAQKVEVNYPTKFQTQQPLSDVINERLRREVTGLIKEGDE